MNTLNNAQRQAVANDPTRLKSDPFDHVRASLRDPADHLSENEQWRTEVKRATIVIANLIRSVLPQSARDKGFAETLAVTVSKWAPRRYSHAEATVGALEVTRTRTSQPKAEKAPLRTTRRHFKELTEDGILHTLPEQKGGSILKKGGTGRQGKAAAREINLQELALRLQSCGLTRRQNDALMDAVRSIKNAHQFADSEREAEQTLLGSARDKKTPQLTGRQQSPKAMQPFENIGGDAATSTDGRVSRVECHKGGSCHPIIKPAIKPGSAKDTEPAGSIPQTLAPNTESQQPIETSEASQPANQPTCDTWRRSENEARQMRELQPLARKSEPLPTEPTTGIGELRPQEAPMATIERLMMAGQTYHQAKARVARLERERLEAAA